VCPCPVCPVFFHFFEYSGEGVEELVQGLWTLWTRANENHSHVRPQKKLRLCYLPTTLCIALRLDHDSPVFLTKWPRAAGGR
jgi:hypothetical protein